MHRLPVVCAGFCIVAAILLWARYHHVVYAAVGVFAAAGFLLYLYRPRPTPTLPNRVPAITFWVLLALSLTAFAFRPDPYSRSLLYFILTAFAAGSLAISMLHHPRRRQMVGVWAVGLSLIWTQMVMFPTLIGIDPYWHQHQAQQIIARGGIIEFPAASGLHYITALLMTLTGMEYRWAVFAGGTVPQVVLDSLIMYGVGGMLAGKRTGLLAALATVIGNWHLFFGAWVIPNTIALTPVLALVYFLLRWYRDRQRRWALLIVPTLAWAGLTHALATVWTGIILVAALSLFVWQGRAHLRRVVPAAAFVFACLGGEAWLWWVTGYMNTLRLLANSRFDPTELGFTAPPMSGVAQAVAPGVMAPAVPLVPPASPALATPPPATETLTVYQWESLLNSSGMLLFFALALTGMLVLVHRRRIGGMFVVGVVCALVLLSTVPMLVGMSVVEHRWWYAAQALSAAPLAVALLRLRSAVWVGGIVAALAFFGAIGLPTNIDNRDLSPNQIVRYALTQEEIDGTRRVMELAAGQVGVDSYLTFAANFMPEYRVRMEGISKQLVDGKLESLPPTVIIREEVRRRAFGFGEGKIWKLEYDPVAELERMGYREFYRNKDLVALRRL